MQSKGEQMAANMAGANAPAQPKSATAAIIGVIGSLIASGLSYAGSRWAQRRNEQLTQSQNQWNLDMWQRQNQYNLPSSQVARLKSAGLNPALIYGNGGIQNEAADAAPAADYHNVQNPAAGLQSPIDPFTASQIRLNEAQAQSIEDANTRENEKQGSVLVQLQRQNEQLEALTTNYRELLDGIKSDNAKKRVESAIAVETKDLAIQQITDNAKIKHDEASYYVLSMMSEIGLKESQEELNRSRARLSDAEIRKIDNDIAISKEYLKIEQDYLYLAQLDSGMSIRRYLSEEPYFDQNAKNQADIFEANARFREKEKELIQKYGDTERAFQLLSVLVRSGHDVVDSYTDIHPATRKGKQVVKTSSNPNKTTWTTTYN